MAVDKAVDSGALDTLFENIGNAIREKDGTTALITPGNMPAKIRAIRTGVDTSDATAAASDIAVGKTAYVNGKKVTGELSLMAQINVSYKGDAIRPVLSQTGITVEGFCEVSGNTLVNDNTKVITSIYIPGDAAPDNVLEGTTFSSEDYIEATGTMPNNGAAAIRLSDLAAKSITAGYYSGGTAKIADAEAAKIIPENIKKGVTILGVEGAMEEGGDYNIAATTNSDGTQNLAITDAGGGSSSGGSGRAPVNLTVTVDPTNAPEEWALDVYGPNGNLVTFDSNNLTAPIPDCTAGDVFIVATSPAPSTDDESGKGYIDSSTVCVNCVFDLSGFATDYTASHAQYCVYGCQIDSDLSAGSEATMTLKFF